MGKNEGGTTVGVVEGVGVSTSGKNWKVTTDKGVMNFPKKNFAQVPAVCQLGATCFFHWSWFEIPNTQNSMRIVNEVREAMAGDTNYDSKVDSAPPTTSFPSNQGKAPNNANQTQKTTTTATPRNSFEESQDARKEEIYRGQALNLAVLLVGQIGKSPDEADYWPVTFAQADKCYDAIKTYHAGAGKFDSGF